MGISMSNQPFDWPRQGAGHTVDTWRERAETRNHESGEWPASWTVCFRDFELDVAKGALWRQGHRAEIHSKPLSLLCFLVANRDRTVSVRELLDAVWPDVTVSEQAVSSALRDLRRALGDHDRSQPIIATRRGQGYRFLPEITERRPIDFDHRRETPFVGRAATMARLSGSFRAAMSGRRQISLVQGACGMGKTRVAEELAARAAASGAVVLFGTAHEEESDNQLWPFALMLRGHGERATVVGELAKTLDKVRAAAARCQGCGTPERDFDRIAALVRAAADEAPLVIVLDDAHWADAASLALLELLARRVDDGRLHLVLTCLEIDAHREDRATSALRRLARSARSDCVALEGLDYAALAHWLHQVGDDAPSDERIDSLRSLTGGNPLFVTELLRHGTATTPAREGETSLVMSPPPRVFAIVQHQLRALAPDAVSLLELASAAGHRFGAGLLANAADYDDEYTLSLLDELVSANLLTPPAEGAASYEFVNGLTRDVIYRSLSGLRRARCHARLAEALERLATPKATTGAQRAQHVAEEAALGLIDGRRVRTGSSRSPVGSIDRARIRLRRRAG